MALVGTMFNWVTVSRAGTWTRIGQGPLVHGVPFERLELSSLTAANTIKAQTISWTLDCYSANWPFYERHRGTTPGVGFAGAPPGFGALSTIAVYLFEPMSPWMEYWLLTDTPCFAHIYTI